MVIKGSAAKRDGERLHPAADVEQEGKKEKREEDGGERMGCMGARTGREEEKREKKAPEKGQGGKRENRERERER